MLEFTTELARKVQEWDTVITLLTPQGQPLSERAVLSQEEGAFCLLYPGDGEHIYGYFKRQLDGEYLDAADYLLSVVGGMIVSCNCPDCEDRRRVCKHVVNLALLTEFGIPSPSRCFMTAPAQITTANRLTESDLVTRRIAPRVNGLVDTIRARAARPRPAVMPSADLDVGDFK